MKNNSKGITLITLVITIILLLILSGISISNLTGNGLFKYSKEAKEKSYKAQLKEEIEMTIMDIQMEELRRGNNVTLETLVSGQLESKLGEIQGHIENEEIIGEYKNYDYTIDSNLKVYIGGEITGIKPHIEIITLNNEITEENVKVQVKINILEGNVTLQEPTGAILNIELSNDTDKIFTISKNGKYTFVAISDISGRFDKKTVNINNIVEKPKISIENVAKTSMEVNIINNNIENLSYNYYLNGKLVKNTIERKLKIEDLESGTNYIVKVGVEYNGKELLSDEKSIKTVSYEISDAVEYWPLIENLENRIASSSNGQMIKGGTGDITFKDGAVHLNGESYLQTANNYVFPNDFTMMIQVKNLKKYGNKRISNVLGQGTYSDYNFGSGYSSTYFGWSWDEFWPVMRLTAGNLTSYLFDDYNEHSRSDKLQQNEWNTLGVTKKGNMFNVYFNDIQTGKAEREMLILQEPLSISKPSTLLDYMNGDYKNLIIFDNALSNSEILHIIMQMQ